MNAPFVKLQKTLGMTLIEVLVALSVLAVTLAAGTQAATALIADTERSSQQWLAQLCAENALTAWRLARQFPDIGQTTQNCLQAQQTFQVQLHVFPTPNPNFRRVEAKVILNETKPLATWVTIMGRF